MNGTNRGDCFLTEEELDAFIHRALPKRAKITLQARTAIHQYVEKFLRIIQCEACAPHLSDSLFLTSDHILKAFLYLGLRNYAEVLDEHLAKYVIANRTVASVALQAKIVLPRTAKLEQPPQRPQPVPQPTDNCTQLPRAATPEYVELVSVTPAQALPPSSTPLAATPISLITMSPFFSSNSNTVSHFPFASNCKASPFLTRNMNQNFWSATSR